MSLLYYQLGEQLMLTEGISLVGTVKLYYSGIPCLSLTQGQLRSKQSTSTFFTGYCIDTECGQSWLSDSMLPE